MSLPGGASDKEGNRYERQWGVSRFLRLLEGRHDSIWIERPGKTWAEFSTEKDGLTTWYQVKMRGTTATGTFHSIRDVLKDFASPLAAGERCIFVSGTGNQLQVLVKRVMNSEGSYDLFEKEFADAEEWKKMFTDLASLWNQDPKVTYEWLHNVEVWTQDEERLEESNELRAEKYLQGLPSNSCSVLGNIYDASIHRTISKSKLLRLLDARGVQPIQATGNGIKPRWQSLALELAQDVVEELISIGKFATIHPESGDDYSDWEASTQGVEAPADCFSDAIASANALVDALNEGNPDICLARIANASMRVTQLYDYLLELNLPVHDRWLDARTAVEQLEIAAGRTGQKSDLVADSDSPAHRNIRKVEAKMDFGGKQTDLLEEVMNLRLPRIKKVVAVRAS